MEMNLLQTYINLFANRDDAWYQQKSDGSYHCMLPDMTMDVRKLGLIPFEPVTIDLITKHLNGQVTIGFPSLDLNGVGASATVGLCKWCTWDFDKDDGNAERIIDLLRALGFHPLREARREGRAGHIWVFFSSPVPANKLIRFDQQLRKVLNIPSHEHGGHEFFPKKPAAEKAGSQVRGPLGIHRRPEANGARGMFDEGGSTVEDQLHWLSLQPLSSAETLVEIADQLISTDQKAFEESQKYYFEPIRRVEEKGKFPPFHILEHIHDYRRDGNRFKAQCPCCAAEGMDTSKDNLHIALDGTWFGCWQGYWNTVHTPIMIIKYLTRN